MYHTGREFVASNCTDCDVQAYRFSYDVINFYSNILEGFTTLVCG